MSYPAATTQAPPKQGPARPFFAPAHAQTTTPREWRSPHGYIARDYGFRADDLHALDPDARLAFIESLPSELIAGLEYDWYNFYAREEQTPPNGRWRSWVVLAGRGFGKTRTGAEFAQMKVQSGLWHRVALVGRTKSDVRDVIVEGESGIMAIAPPWFRPVYEPSKRRLTWPNGAIATCYSADEPDQLRGPQHDGAWGDEIASWKFPEALSNLEFGLRLGVNPQAIYTTTPKPTKMLRDLLKRRSTVKTGGSSYDNRVNLSEAWFEETIESYVDTRLGQQEIFAQMLDDNPAALWNLKTMIDPFRVKHLPDLKYIVVAIDPSASSGEGAAEAGIIVAGRGRNNHAYVLEDCTLRGRPAEWGAQALAAYRRWQANLIVAEVNNGGEMVEYVIKSLDEAVRFKAVHASRGKRTRAEPVSTLYERKLVHHYGYMADLEDQMTQWVPDEDPISPDRLDAMVWALTQLMLTGTQQKKRGASIPKSRFAAGSRFLPAGRFN